MRARGRGPPDAGGLRHAEKEEHEEHGEGAEAWEEVHEVAANATLLLITARRGRRLGQPRPAREPRPRDGHRHQVRLTNPVWPHGQAGHHLGTRQMRPGCRPDDPPPPMREGRLPPSAAACARPSPGQDALGNRSERPQPNAVAQRQATTLAVWSGPTWP